jgi:hypothetical protein
MMPLMLLYHEHMKIRDSLVASVRIVLRCNHNPSKRDAYPKFDGAR